MRSIQDRDQITSMVPEHRHHRVHVAPDIAFGAPSLFAPSPNPGGPVVLFCPTNFMSVQYKDVVHLIQRKLWQHPEARLVYLALDGLSSPSVYPSPFVTEEVKRFKSYFPDAVIYTGRHLSPAFRRALGLGTPPSDSVVQTLDVCVDLFRRAVCVITGRYHGLVLAKAFGVPFEIGSANLAKLVNEVSSPLRIQEWDKSYRLLRRDIATHFNIPESRKAALIRDPDLWTEDERNTVITDIVTQAPEWVSTVPYVQGYSNHTLWQRKRDLLLDGGR